MDEAYYKRYEPLFNSWYITRPIGEGSFGQVYEIERREMGVVYKAALKTIAIPQSRSEIKSIKADGMSDADVTAYYRGIVQDINNELIMMTRLKGTSNVVSYEDHMLIEHKGEIGWDILIRMELLTPLFDHIANKGMTRREVVRLGIDLCGALELCRKYNIIHRDVKPENIFISNNGDYKLGDFGIAKTVEKTSSGMSRKGTYTYMAPEIYRGDAYGSSVDIYSLGIVMYRLLNNNRTPFLPPYPAPITFNIKEEALLKRIGGAEIPPPINSDEKLSQVVLKACAFEPKKRYESALQMRQALEELLAEQDDMSVVTAMSEEVANASAQDPVKTGGNRESVKAERKQKAILEELTEKTESDFGSEIPSEWSAQGLSEKEETETLEMTISRVDNVQGESTAVSPAQQQKSAQHKKGKTKKSMTGALVAALALAAVLIFVLIPKTPVAVEDITGIDNQVSLYIGGTLAPEYKIVPEELVDEPIEFSVQDKKIITVDEKGVLTAVGLGETTLTLSAAEFEKTVAVTVNAKVTDITGIDETIELEEGDSLQLKPKILPEEFAEETITYRIAEDSASTIASVNETGKITGIAAGKTMLIISSGGYEKSVTIVVTEYVEPTSAPVYYQPQTTAPTTAPKPTQSSDSEEGYWE